LPLIVPPDRVFRGSWYGAAVWWSLVRPDWVVTATHCLYNSPRWRMPGELRMRVGVLNRCLAEESQQETRVALQYITQTISYTRLWQLTSISLLQYIVLL